MRYHSRDADFLAWLASLTPEEQYVTRCAFLRVFKSFQKDWDFKADTETLRALLNPDQRQLQELWKRARERAEIIEQALARNLG